jgi:hypothetical protein
MAKNTKHARVRLPWRAGAQRVPHASLAHRFRASLSFSISSRVISTRMRCTSRASLCNIHRRLITNTEMPVRRVVRVAHTCARIKLCTWASKTSFVLAASVGAGCLGMHRRLLAKGSKKRKSGPLRRETGEAPYHCRRKSSSSLAMLSRSLRRYSSACKGCLLKTGYWP